LTLLVVAGILLSLLSCDSKRTGPVVVFASPDSPRLRQVVAGLEAGFGNRPLKVVCVPELGPKGDEGLRQVRAERPRLIIVLGTAALLKVAPVEKKTPVVFAMVANPYFTGAAYDAQRPDVHQGNITGFASPPPLTVALEQGGRLLGPCPWGLVYDPLEGGAVEVAEQFTKEARRLGLTPLLELSSNAATDRRALEKLRERGARVIYLPATAGALRYAEILLAWGRERKVMVVSSQPEIAPHGAILYVALNYRRLGEETAVLALRVLNGEDPAKIPITEKTPLRMDSDDSLVRFWSGYPPASPLKKP